MTNVFIPSDIRVLNALAVILPAGTTISPANVYIEASISVAAGGFPALVLSMPGEDDRVREGIGPAASMGWTHQVMALYLDSWVSSTRTYGQLKADARRTLNQMIANYSENTSLVASYTTEDGISVTNEANALEIRQHIKRHVGDAVTDANYGFPLLSAWLRFDIQGLWERWTPT